MIDISSISNEYPFTPKVLPLPHNGKLINYSYLDEGEGEPLLMLHGNPTWSFYYRNLVKKFSKTNRVVVPDHMGCGLSWRPDDYEYNLENHISNIEHLVRKLGLKNITLCVHDWGGAIGFGFATRHPELIKRLVIFNTSAFRSHRIPLSIRICKIPKLGEWIVRNLNGFLGPALDWAYATEKPKLFTKEVKAGYELPYSNPEDRMAIARFVQDIPMNEKHPSYKTLLETEYGLHKFEDTPTIIIWGMKDFCFNDHFLKKWQEFLPKAEVHKMKLAGHWVVEDEQEEVPRLMESFIANSR